jgi:aminoglycoside phosphotransferase (APT) family kinase protein
VDIAQLRSAAERLAEMCAELAALPVPHTIVHGDLHLENVSRGEHGFVIFDWTDACVSHPFIDMIMIRFEHDEAVKARLRDAYLDQWSGFGSAAELRRAWQLAEPLTALNHAIGYISLWSVVRAEAADREFGSATTRFLRSLVDATPPDA